jgi:exonuclease SbcD
MRVLHTSDWHLGVDYFGRPRLEEQAAFLSWLLDTIVARQIDAVVVAGDIFDKGAPSAEAQSLYYAFLARLGALGDRTVVVVGGNHDSASRLDAPREVLSALSTHVVGGYAAEREGQGALAFKEGVLVPLRAGNDVQAVVAAVPYLHDWRISVRDLTAEPSVQHAQLSGAFRDIYGRLADAAEAAFPGVPLLATGHLTCLPRAGQKPTEDDSIPYEINRVGTLGAFGPDIFDPRFAYVALGHIHRGFAVDAGRRVWYSGTPMQVSRTEAANARRVLVVDTEARTESGALVVEAVAVPVTRRLVHVTGTFDEVEERLKALTWDANERPPLVSAEAVRDRYMSGAERFLREAALANSAHPVDLVEARVVVQSPYPLMWVTMSGPADPVEPRIAVHAKAEVTVGAVDLPRGDEITPEAAFSFAWRNAHYGEAPSDEVLAHFRALLEAEV